MGCEKDTEYLKVETRTRGVLPQKLSELENDVPYATKEDLDKVVVKGGNGYTGLETNATKVEVDNIERTIGVTLKDVWVDYFDIDPLTGKIPDGNYILSATVENGKPTYFWAMGGIVTSAYYYGWTQKAIDGFMADDLLAMEKDDSAKSDKSYLYHVADQARVVMAYPASYGSLSKIIYTSEGQEFNIISTFEIKNLLIDGTPYLVYITYDTTYLDEGGEGITYKFIY